VEVTIERMALKLALPEAAAPTMKASPPPPLPPPEKRSVVPGVVLGGVAVGAAVAGVGLLVASSGKRQDMLALDQTIVHQDHQRCVGTGPIDAHCAALISAARDASTFHNVGVGMFVGTGLFAAGALTYLLWPASTTKKAGIDPHALPVVGVGHGGLIIGGAF